jgi:hypothetical protein
VKAREISHEPGEPPSLAPILLMARLDVMHCGRREGNDSKRHASLGKVQNVAVLPGLWFTAKVRPGQPDPLVLVQVDAEQDRLLFCYHPAINPA